MRNNGQLSCPLFLFRSTVTQSRRQALISMFAIIDSQKTPKRNYIMSNKRRKERRGEGKRRGSEWEGKGAEEEAVDGSGIKCKNFS